MAKKLQVGDVRWECEWCTKYAIDENGEHDFDADEMTFRDFPTIEEARAFAKTCRPQGYGFVQIRKKVLMPCPYSRSRTEWQYAEGVEEEIDVPYV